MLADAAQATARSPVPSTVAGPQTATPPSDPGLAIQESRPGNLGGARAVHSGSVETVVQPVVCAGARTGRVSGNQLRPPSGVGTGPASDGQTSSCKVPPPPSSAVTPASEPGPASVPEVVPASTWTPASEATPPRSSKAVELLQPRQIDIARHAVKKPACSRTVVLVMKLPVRLLRREAGG